MIDILIPTYNRIDTLKKNILLLDKLMCAEKVCDRYRVIVSDNCSVDQTADQLELLKKDVSYSLVVYKQQENIGLEKNAIFLLCKSDSEYIIYLGDDDFLPSGYLRFIVDKIDNEQNIALIIPGFSSLYPDGSIRITRNEKVGVKKYAPSIGTALKLSSYGHQLSGLFLKRAGLSEIYLENNSLRNLYPFVFFVSLNSIRGISYYAPAFQVLVSQGNVKDWRYDDSGLLTDVFKNFRILYPSSLLKRVMMCWAFAYDQSWRLRINKPIKAVKAFYHICRSNEIDLIFKISLLFLYPIFYISYLYKVIKKYLRIIRLKLGEIFN